MENHITKIKKVEIKGLWNRFDLSWTLNPDVNVLSGINGSGKSTILNGIVQTLTGAVGHYHKLVDKIIVSFNDGNDFKFLTMKKNLTKKELTEFLTKLKIAPDDNADLSKNKAVAVIISKPLTIKIDIISTFDTDIIANENKPDKMVHTELDKVIFRLQKEYLDFQLNLSKKIYELIVKNSANSHSKVLAMRQTHERFLEIIDQLFETTGKKINRDKNEITILCGKEELTPYQLSSGEKQMLVILLTVLVQDKRPSVLFMDEPEISLHFDWQKKLIQYIRELNPNVQIILATHSPAVIMEGWLDKVFEVSDLVTPVKTNAKK